MILAEDIGLLAAFRGGFSAFFSAWQLCIMQITPFYLAFTVGLYQFHSGESFRRRLTAVLPAGAGYLLGFSLVFGSLGTPGLAFSRYLKYNIASLKIAAAVYIGIVAVLLLVFGITGMGRGLKRVYLPIGLLLGASFAAAYSPCITPVMSDIMNFAGRGGNAIKGFALLVSYGAGLSVAFHLSGTVISETAGYLADGKRARSLLIVVSSTLLFLMTFLLITGLMTSYKSFLVGLVLD